MKQSPNDFKQYQPLTLDNGLRVLLVHNQESNKSAAALAVNVGHFSDPIDRQGLAHFLEHMLFLGTEKYPDGSEYQQFISQYGGTNNAWTATEHTCFFFDIHHLHFAEALDRFSQFFIAPLLSEEFVNKERKNIDAEFKLKLKDDIRRLYDVHKETINPAHPFAKFSVGNTETLCDKADRCLRDEVANFFTLHYVAKAMTLVIEGPQSIKELESLAIIYFSALSAKEIQDTLPEVPLYQPQHQKVSLQVKPVINDHQLIISFALPSIDQYYREKPESLISYLLGHEGPNSILSLLKSKHWALGLTAGAGVNGYNFKDFNISIRLTDIGEQHVDDIIDIVFAYISLLKQQPLPCHYYQEKKALAQLSFQYHEKMKPLDSVCQLVINMQHYPPEDYIFGDYAMDGCDPSIISQLLSKFTVENMRYVVVSQKVETNKVSRWYQVPYKVSAIPPEKIKRWQKIKKITSLALPPVNDYIDAKPSVHSANIDTSTQQTIPHCITEESGLTIWFKQDITFKIPKGYIYIGIDSQETLKSTKHIAMTRLFVDLYTDAVIEQHYDAELAGIHYHLYAHQGGLTLQLSGVSSKQDMLLTQLLTELQNFEFAENKFTLLKYQLINHWKNANNSKSISQLFSSLSAIMQPKAPSTEHLANALTQVSYAEFANFCQQIFQAISLEVLLHGNWRPQDARQIEAIIKQAFKQQYHQDNKVITESITIEGKGNISVPLHLPEHDYAAVLYYPMTERSLAMIAKTMITSQILSPLFFQIMRTEQQYGYLVGVGYVPINRYPGLAFYIQSPKYQADQLVAAMDEFINSCHNALEQMSEEDWQHLQHGLTSQLQENDTSLRIRSQRFWAAICNQEKDFKQKQRLIDCILALSKDDISNFILESLTNLNTVQDRFELMSIKHPKQGSTKAATQVNNKNLANFRQTCSIKV
ncbi:peptidase M16 [Thalassotalea insulae]|uniref:Protease 3 n=1 Tax=Thalassotalea insulae TaxID=2056778 RepID=A0ABQ6GSC0_9GAMM|nr:insulinase family protein [Thalassotalea insulae]GLX77537.1 peptidase M16 [Thalassotalea insulae]